MVPTTPVPAARGGFAFANCGILGAYGLTLTGLEAVGRYLVPAPAEWPEITVEWVDGPHEARPNRLTESEAEFWTAPDSDIAVGIQVQRSPLRARLICRGVLDDEALVHPVLTIFAAMVNQWFGRAVFHAGAFCSGPNTWGVLGAKEAGKSSLLGHLAAGGHKIVADDLLVIDNGQALAGARCVDLREGAAHRLGQGRYLGTVGRRERWRVAVPPIPPAVALTGWIVPEWGEQIEVSAVPVAERLKILCANLGLDRPPARPEQLLELAALPFLRFRRPARWDLLEESTDVLSARLRRESGLAA